MRRRRFPRDRSNRQGKSPTPLPVRVSPTDHICHRVNGLFAGEPAVAGDPGRRRPQWGPPWLRLWVIRPRLEVEGVGHLTINREPRPPSTPDSGRPSACLACHPRENMLFGQTTGALLRQCHRPRPARFGRARCRSSAERDAEDRLAAWPPARRATTSLGGGTSKRRSRHRTSKGCQHGHLWARARRYGLAGIICPSSKPVSSNLLGNIKIDDVA